VSVVSTLLLAAGSGCGGSGGSKPTSMGAELKPENLISDFENRTMATVVDEGTPPRNGFWYAYNYMTTCTQTPTPNDASMKYVGVAPPTLHPGATGSYALRASWSGCNNWGAGIGADLNRPDWDGGTDGGPKLTYDVTPYTGVTFWGITMANGDGNLRIKFTMTEDTKVVEGGTCDESMLGLGKCDDNFGENFTLPAGGMWKQFTVKWSDANFAPIGWGHPVPWNPTHVMSIQIQSQDASRTYDFFIDDLYFIN
jgi:hypothetical protein